MKLLLSLISLLLSVYSVYSQDKLDQVENITDKLEKFIGKKFDFEYYTGWVPVGTPEQGVTSLFFSMVTKQGETLESMSKDTPVLFWFNGGPGCSSQYGNFLEIGPFKVIQNNDVFNLDSRETSWNQHAALVFIDQPIGAGLSYTSDSELIVTKTPDASVTLKLFLQKFYGQHFQTLVPHPTYFFGESYAGHYIPYFASMVVKEQPVEGLNFQGIGIGDGWTNAQYQLTSFANYTYNVGIASQGLREDLEAQQKIGVNDILKGDYSAASKVFDDISGNVTQYGEIDQYNIHYYQYPGQEDPQTIALFQDLLNQEDFREVYGIPSFVPEFSNCNNTIYMAFYDDITRSYQSYVEYLIDEGVKVLLFNGQLDMIVNTPGAQDWIDTINTKEFTSEEWQNAQKKVWHATGSKRHVIGNYQRVSNFVYANIYLAGHMVPSDQPEASMQMLETYLDWAW